MEEHFNCLFIVKIEKPDKFKAGKLQRRKPQTTEFVCVCVCLAFQHSRSVDLKMFILKKLVTFYTAIQSP